MATIHTLAGGLGLELVETQLRPGEFPDRWIYLAPEAIKWINDDLPQVLRSYDAELEPTEQIEDLFYRFISGKNLDHWTDLHAIYPHVDGTWELKTNDIRMFGWFPCRDCVVILHIESMIRCKEFPAFPSYYRGRIVKYRESLDLDEPKFVRGAELRDVISD